LSYRELLVGCGNSREKRVAISGTPTEFQNLTTLDHDPSCNPDVVWDLNVLPYPFEDETFDEVCAFEVLEHLGTQGDYKFFFDQFSEFHRILKPEGLFLGSVPMWTSPWAFGDPSHRRVMPKHMFGFLSQKQYEQVGNTPCTDFRGIWKKDFEIIGFRESEHTLEFAFRKK
jgi:SAM-dependent methyltransferase